MVMIAYEVKNGVKVLGRLLARDVDHAVELAKKFWPSNKKQSLQVTPVRKEK
jgi:hypothetical protein